MRIADYLQSKSKQIESGGDSVQKKSSLQSLYETKYKRRDKKDGFDMNWRAWLDRLQRGQYMTAAMAKESLYKKPEDKNLMKAAWRGITGREKASFRDIAERENMPAPFWTGLAGDIFLDPTTYLTFGGLTKAGTKASKLKKLGLTAASRAKKGEIAAVKYMGMPIVKGAKAYEIGGKIGSKAIRTPGLSTVLKAFKVTTGIPKLDKMVKKYRLAETYGKTRAMEMGQKWVTTINKIAKSTSRSVDDVNSEVIRLIEKARYPTLIKKRATSKEVGKLANELRRTFKSTILREQKAGVPIAQLGTARKATITKLQKQLEKAVAGKRLKVTSKLQQRLKILKTETGMLKKRLPAELRDVKGKVLVKGVLPGQRQTARMLLQRETEAGKLGRKIKGVAQLKAKQLGIGKGITRRIDVLKRQRELGYFPRFLSDEVQQYMKKARVGNRKVWNPHIANALKRKTGEWTLDEVNVFFKAHGLEKLGGRKFEEFFLKDPAYVGTTRALRSIKAVSSANFLDEVGKTFGVKGKTPIGWTESSHASLKGLKFDPEVLNEIDRAYGMVTRPETMNSFIKTIFDPTQRWWKAHVLSYFPAYHSRNAVSNMWNNFLGGVHDPTNYADAVRLQVYDALKVRGVKVPKPKLMKGLNVDQVILTGKKMGIPGRGMVGIEVPRSVEQEILKGNWDILSQRFHLVKGGRNVGRTIEDNARWAHYIDKLRKGMGVDEAADSVKKYLFDYEELTEFERKVMKRVFPFYTWSRKNIPLQLETLATKPGKIAVIPKVKGAVEYGKEPPRGERAILPPWIEERLPVRLGKDEKGQHKYFPLESYLPTADLMKLGRPARAVGEMLDPYFLKMPMEALFDRSLYYDQPLEKYPGERVNFLGMDIPAKMAGPARSIRLLSELHRLAPKPKAKGTTMYQSPELTGKEKAVRALTGIKLEKIDPGRQLQFYYKAQQKQLSKLKSAYYKAMATGRKKEAARIRETMKRLIYEKLVKPFKEDNNVRR